MNTVTQDVLDWSAGILADRAAMPALTEDDPRWPLAYPMWAGSLTPAEVIVHLRKLNRKFRLDDPAYLDAIFMETATIPLPPVPAPAWSETATAIVTADVDDVFVEYTGPITEIGPWCTRAYRKDSFALRNGRVNVGPTIVRYGKRFGNGEIGWQPMDAQEAEQLAAALLNTIAAARENGAHI
jgi:hypothetical protein